MAVSLQVRQRDNPVRMTVTMDAEPVRLSVTERGGQQYDEYTGEYVVTPGSTSVVLETKDKVLHGRITVNPVPSNYGLITWNGSVITVS